MDNLGKVLRVNLTEGTVKSEPVRKDREEFHRGQDTPPKCCTTKSQRGPTLFRLRTS